MAPPTRQEPLQLPRAAKRGDGKTDKNNPDGDGYADQPMREVASPGAESGVQPAQRKDSEAGADELVEKLPENAPQPPEATGFSSVRNRSHNR